MRLPNFSRRERIGLAVVVALSLIALFPMRIALGLASADTAFTALSVRGPVWWGHIEGANIGGAVDLGNVDAAVSPVQLLVGRVRLDLWRKGGQADDFSGAWSVGFNQRGIDDLTGSVPVAAVFAPLPLSTMEFDDFTVHFAGDTCAEAEGQVRVRITGQFAGLNLSQGLSGAATCDGTAVLLPLVSQTGLERLTLRLWRDGRYTAQFAVKGGANANSTALAMAGLKQNGEDYVMSLEGRM